METTAMVDTLVVSDRIYLSIIISEEDTKGKSALEVLERNMNATLTGLGINTKTQLSVSDVASNFKNYFLKGKDILKNKSYTLEVYDAKTAGEVIIALETINISNVSILKTSYSRLEALKMELRQKAVVKAKLQGDYLLKPLNQHLGPAIHISDYNANTYNRLQDAPESISIKAYKSDSGTMAPLDIVFEKIEIKSTVTVHFAILD
ncbi:SIMPL domain-containing protein [Formosa sp. S-31]